MLQTYEAVLNGDRIEWSGSGPGPVAAGRPFRVQVTFLDQPMSEAEELERRKRAVAALRALAALPADQRVGLPTDPVARQREMRKDRPLPGREE